MELITLVYKTGLALTLTVVILVCTAARPAAESTLPLPAHTPGDATYRIDGEAYTLRDGQVIVESLPGAASMTMVQLYGEPVQGDLDGDGVLDAALLLVQTTGGSGTFYYVAAALNRDGGFVGTPAVLLGDRIEPLQLAIRYGVVIIDYADRRPAEPMSTPPSLAASKYLVCRGEVLEQIPLADGELIAAGEVVIGHEVRSFTPCGADQAAWLVGDSPALPAVLAAYQTEMTDAPLYAPLFMVLTGQPVARPAEGFGHDFTGGFRASGLVLSRPGAVCADPGQ
jgi:hypothetical protein